MCEKNLNMNTIDIMKVEEQCSKLFRKADITTKFELRCWLDYCRKNKVVEFDEFLVGQSLHNFIDKLHCNFIDISDIGTDEEIEEALINTFFS